MRHNFVEDANFTDDMSFGEYIRKKRRLLGMNQADFGEYIGEYNYQTVGLWEMGERSPSFEEAVRIIRLLGGEVPIINKRNEY